MSMKNSNDAIGNQTRDVPACSAVPQPTAPPLAPWLYRWGMLITLTDIYAASTSRKMEKHDDNSWWGFLVF
jgi:hypothetical protein